ncbi:hypothetical protein AB0C33_01835 [Nonomuraea sp. NPDC048881]|uniref:hypothetical protein n=1 Tax=Nonomuraea sp. NPDC048881 TaxID=3155030 RepID=UPI0033F60C50
MENAYEMSTERKSASLVAAVDEYMRIKSLGSWSKTGSSTACIRSTLNVFTRELEKRLKRSAYTTDLTDETVMGIIHDRWPNDGIKTTHAGQWGRIKTFIRWLAVSGYQVGPLHAFLGTRPVRPKPQVSFMFAEEEAKVFDSTYAYSPKDAWLIRIGYLLRRRAGELGAMKVGDFKPKPTPDAPHGTYTFTNFKAKNGRKTLRLTTSQREAFDGWLADYERLVGQKPLADWYMFPNSKGDGKVTPGKKRGRRLLPEEPIKDLPRIWREAFKEAGVYSRWKASHAGRRGGLTDLFYALEEAGVSDPMQHVQRTADHSDRRVTAGYIQMDEGERKTHDALQLVDDIRAGRAPAPSQTEQRDERQSATHTGENMAEVIHVRFGQSRR